MNYTVSVNGTEVRTRSCRIFPAPYNSEKEMEYVMFGMDGKTDIEISSETEIKSAVIRPLKKNTAFELRDGKIFFSVDRPAKLSVEINGSRENNLMIFAHDAARETPPENTGRLIAIRRGETYKGTLKIAEDNTTVYIEDGAVIDGNIYAENSKNITVCGFGRICMENYTYEMRRDFARSIDIYKCSNVVIKDIIIDDSNDWSLRVNGCDNVDISNVKIFGCRGNSDGIDVCGSRNVTVSDIFTRVWDDSFVVKALDTGNAENIVFKDSVLWNDFARPIEVGVELRADFVRNIRFENIDILHSTTGYPVMGIHHGDHARVSDISFKNIRIEDAPGAQLFDMRITDSVWNRDGRMGDIRDISFSDISYIGTDDNGTLLSNSRVEGFDAEHDIRNVSFHNIEIGGRAAKTEEELGLDVCGFAENVSVTYIGAAEELSAVSCALGTRDFVLGKDGKYTGTVFARLWNETGRRLSGTAVLAVSPKNAETEREFEYDIAPGGAAEVSFEMSLQPGRYIFFTKDRKKGIKNAWTFAEFDVIIREGCAGAPVYDFVNYYGDREASVSIFADGGCLAVLSEKDMPVTVYTAKPVKMRAGEVVFSAEETDFGEVCAFVEKDGGLAAAPQLRCPAEITYVFKNEPKTKIIKTELMLKGGEPSKLPLDELGAEDGEFWLEIAAHTEKTKELRYPYTLFRSTAPENTSHMFGHVKVIKNN